MRSPIGKSGHNTVYWPSLSTIRTVGKIQKKTVRPLLKPNMHEFGRWITITHGMRFWLPLTQLTKLEHFILPFMKPLIGIFQQKTVKLHTTDKPWITPEIKQLIKIVKKRLGKKMHLRCFLRSRVARLIDRTKKFCYKERIQNLETCDPAGWHKGSQVFTNKTATVTFHICPWYPTKWWESYCWSHQSKFRFSLKEHPQLHVVSKTCLLTCLQDPLHKSMSGNVQGT